MWLWNQMTCFESRRFVPHKTTKSTLAVTRSGNVEKRRMIFLGMKQKSNSTVKNTKAQPSQGWAANHFGTKW